MQWHNIKHTASPQIWLQGFKFCVEYCYAVCILILDLKMKKKEKGIITLSCQNHPAMFKLLLFFDSQAHGRKRKCIYILTKTAEHVISKQLVNPLTFINPFTTTVLDWLIILLCFRADSLYSSQKKLWLSDCSFMHLVFGYHLKQYHIKLLPF